MTNDGWKDDLRSCFAGIRLIEVCKHDTLLNFSHFCEFIAEPAFESLTEELKEVGLRTKYRRQKDESAAFEIDFPKSRRVQFSYIITLPKNSVDLKLTLKIRGRKMESSPFEDIDLPFMQGTMPGDVLKLTKEDLILDIVERYRDFMYRALTSPA